MGLRGWALPGPGRGSVPARGALVRKAVLWDVQALRPLAWRLGQVELFASQLPEMTFSQLLSRCGGPVLPSPPTAAARAALPLI